ncbi:hypothetical protein C7S13_5914 [Burkholderia cepacia]|nr:hypothetical protein [Burkholderia cepacia]
MEGGRCRARGRVQVVDETACTTARSRAPACGIEVFAQVTS